MVLSLAKKKFDKIFINANAGTPYPKNFKAAAVITTSFTEKDPYPNNAFTISFEAKINPKLAGIENKRKRDLLTVSYSDNMVYLFVKEPSHSKKNLR